MSKTPLALVVSFACAVGCQGQPDVEEAKTPETKKPEKTVAEKPVHRTSMEGNWIVRLTLGPNSGFQYRDVVLISIKKVGADYKVTLPGQIPDGFSVAKSEITSKAAQIALRRQGKVVLDLEVTLDDTVARGNAAAAGEKEILPVVLIATDRTRNPFSEPKQHEHIKELGAEPSAKAKDGKKKLREFLTKHPRSPISFFVCRYMNPLAARAKEQKPPTDDEFRAYLKVLDTHVRPWGVRAHADRRLKLVEILRILHLAPNVVREIMQASKEYKFHEYIGDRGVDDLTTLSIVEASCADAVTAKDPAVRKKAIKVLEGYVVRRFRFMAFPNFRLAQAYERDGQDEKALMLYAWLEAIPAMQSELADELRYRKEKFPEQRENLEKLWVKVKGNKAGLDAYLTTLYAKALRELTTAVVAQKPGETAKRTVLCELSTNSHATEAVAAELAMTSAQRCYPASDLIVLRYHLDKPGRGAKPKGAAKLPDPLTCNDAAFGAFGARMPSVAVNGRPIPLPAQLWTARDQHYQIRQAIDDQQSRPSDYAIRLTGGISGDQLKFQAVVTGPESLPPGLRLRFVVAEERIDFTGDNRIPHHDMVVRFFPAGVDGVKYEKSTTTHNETVDLKKASQRIRDFLQSYEEQRKIKLPFKPVHFKKLHLVAMIQKKRTGEVLQAATISVGAPDTKSVPKKPVSSKPKPGSPKPLPAKR